MNHYDRSYRWEARDSWRVGRLPEIPRARFDFRTLPVRRSPASWFDSGVRSLSETRVGEYSKRPQWGQEHSDGRRRIVDSS